MAIVTAPGERVMRPQFGCRIWDLLFEPITPSLFGLVAQAVYEALGQWEPRIVVDEVTPTGDDADDGVIQVRVAYRVRTTNDPRKLAEQRALGVDVILTDRLPAAPPR